jgi:hypothetical protein
LCFSAIPAGPTAAAIAALYADNCSGNTVTATKAGTPTGTNCAWSVTYTYTVQDNCGNIVSPSPTVTYSGSDQTPPALIVAGSIPAGGTGLNLCFSAIPAGPTAAAIAALYADNCSGNTVTATKAGTPTGNSCGWSVTYTYTVQDNCGNIVSPSPTVTYSGSDQTAPSIGTNTFPVGLTGVNSCYSAADPASLPTNATIAALYSDNCLGVVNVARVRVNTSTNNCNWSYTYTYTITDICGNTVLPKPTITYSGADATAPLFTGLIPTQTINTGAGVNCSGVIPDYRSLANVTDCGTFTLAQLAPNAPGTMVFGQGGNIIVVIEATDACGNKSQTSFTVELRDLTPPNAICKPFTLVLNASGTGSIVVANVNNGSFDNCTPTPDLIYSLSQTNFTCANVGTNTVTLTVTDNCNNSSTCTAIVTVIDNTKPVISCWGDTTIAKDANCSYTLPNLTFRVNKADACGIGSVTQSIPVGTIFGASVTIVPITLTVTDVNGNSSTCTFNITLIDVTPPTIINCPGNIIVNTGLGNTTCNKTATWTVPTVFDV